MVHGPLRLAVAGLEIVDELADGHVGHLLVELVELLLAFFAPLGELLQDLLQLALQILDGALDALALFLGQLLEAVLIQGLAVLARGEGEAPLAHDQGDVVLLRLLLDLADRLLLAAAELALQLLEPALVFLALEDGRDRRAQLIAKLVEVRGEAPALTGRQCQQARLVGIVEVVEIAAIGGDGLGLRARFEKPARDGVLADAVGPEHEQVVALGAHAGAEVQRLDRPILAQEFREIGQVGGGLEIEGCDVTGLVEVVD